MNSKRFMEVLHHEAGHWAGLQYASLLHQSLSTNDTNYHITMHPQGGEFTYELPLGLEPADRLHIEMCVTLGGLAWDGFVAGDFRTERIWECASQDGAKTRLLAEESGWPEAAVEVLYGDILKAVIGMRKVIIQYASRVLADILKDPEAARDLAGHLAAENAKAAEAKDSASRMPAGPVH